MDEINLKPNDSPTELTVFWECTDAKYRGLYVHPAFERRMQRTFTDTLKDKRQTRSSQDGEVRRVIYVFDSPEEKTAALLLLE